MPGRVLCERHCSNNPSRFKPKGKLTIDGASVLLASESKAKRKKGMEMLCELHASELIASHVLKETDASILGIASEALDHHPPELIRHFLTQPSAYDASLYIRFRVALGNHLYAEETIRAVYSERRTLTLHAIDGIGRAYLRSLSGLLHKYLSASLELYEDALRSKGSKAVAGVDATNCWSRKGRSAVQSAIALARLDSDIDIGEVDRLLNDAERIQLELSEREYWAEGVRERISRSVLGTRAYLEWVLFDKGVRSTSERVLRLVRAGAIEVLPDLATTILKHRDEDSLREVTQEFPSVYFVDGGFCFWPLMNWLEYKGLLAPNEYGPCEGRTKGSLYPFWCARANGIDPPQWWNWR